MLRAEYERNLETLGFELLGKGLYSRVYAIPNHPDKVIKVADRDGWLEYIRWATERGYAGKFAPKVFSLKFHNQDGFYVAIMERLVDTVGQMRNSSTISDLFHTITDWKWRKKETDEKHPDLHAFMRELDQKQMINDLHDGNAMVRSDGQIVITDPLTIGSTDKYRIKSGTLAYA